jgi:hypothetical protein
MPARSTRARPMDGLRLLPHFRAPRLLAAVAAVLVAAGSAETAAAVDEPADASARWPVDGAAVQTALAIAQDFWGIAPCRGEVTLAWEDLDPSLDAQAIWANDAGGYADPVRNTGCEVSFNPRGQWDWPKLCTVMVHEMGHLAGRDHVDDPDDVMYYTYRHPVRQCAKTPEPATAAAPERPAAAPAPAAARVPGKAAKKPAAAAVATKRRDDATPRRPSRQTTRSHHRRPAAKRRSAHRR